MSHISRRGFLGVASAAWLRAQDTQRPVFKGQGGHGGAQLHRHRQSYGKYINNLKNTDFRIYEDGIVQKMSTFAEGTKPPMQVMEDGTLRPLVAGESIEAPGKPGIDLHSDAFVGTNVFVLFDTSNFMYRGFVYAEDAIADFVRGLDRADSVAVYTFSRNLSRAAGLTRDRGEAIGGLRKAVAGDETALYNTFAADPARCRPGTRPQSRHRIFERPGQCQHGGARRRTSGGRG